MSKAADAMTLADACAVTDQFGRFLKGLGKLQEAAATLRGAEQLITERTAIAAKLAADIAAAQNRLEEIQAQSAAVKEAAADIEAAAKARAEALIEVAKESANKVKADAEESAQSARKDAQAHAAAADSAVKAKAAAEAELADISARLAQAHEAARKAFGA